MFRKIYWRLLGFKFLSISGLGINSVYKIKSQFYKQNYNEFKIHYNKRNKENEIWGKINKNKPKIEERDWYSWILYGLPTRSIAYQTNFMGVVRYDGRIFSYKDRGNSNNKIYDNIGDYLFKNNKYNNNDYLILGYNLENKILYNINKMNLVENNLIFIMREESLERCQAEIKRYCGGYLEVRM
jgi:hypothetical protein